tara:strand:- start:350 stop:1186 length:837 start_codon:yes stop_codon:yes gene_type:complete
MDYNYIDLNSNISGIPMNDFNNNVSYDYVINNLDSNLNMDVCSDSGQNENVANIIKIKNGLISILNDNTISDNIINEYKDNKSEPESSQEPEPESSQEPEPEPSKEPEENMIDKMCSMYSDFIEKYKIEQDKYFECEKQFNKEIENSKSDIKKLDLIVKFMHEIDQEVCNNQLIEDTIDNLNSVSKEIEDNSKLERSRKEYIMSRLEINKYLKMIKKINNVNVANICPLCLSNNVSLYLNPCGHTCCDECYDRLTEREGNKCFLCRQHIMNKNPLYFS